MLTVIVSYLGKAAGNTVNKLFKVVNCSCIKQFQWPFIAYFYSTVIALSAESDC